MLNGRYVGGYITRQYKSCAEDLGGNQGQRKTGDLCVAPGTDNLTLMLAGVATELVYDSAAKFWRRLTRSCTTVAQVPGN